MKKNLAMTIRRPSVLTSPERAEYLRNLFQSNNERIQRPPILTSPERVAYLKKLFQSDNKYITKIDQFGIFYPTYTFPDSDETVTIYNRCLPCITKEVKGKVQYELYKVDLEYFKIHENDNFFKHVIKPLLSNALDKDFETVPLDEFESYLHDVIYVAVNKEDYMPHAICVVNSEYFLQQEAYLKQLVTLKKQNPQFNDVSIYSDILSNPFGRNHLKDEAIKIAQENCKQAQPASLIIRGLFKEPMAPPKLGNAVASKVVSNISVDAFLPDGLLSGWFSFIFFTRFFKPFKAFADSSQVELLKLLGRQRAGAAIPIMDICNLFEQQAKIRLENLTQITPLFKSAGLINQAGNLNGFAFGKCEDFSDWIQFLQQHYNNASAFPPIDLIETTIIPTDPRTLSKVNGIFNTLHTLFEKIFEAHIDKSTLEFLKDLFNRNTTSEDPNSETFLGLLNPESNILPEARLDPSVSRSPIEFYAHSLRRYGFAQILSIRTKPITLEIAKLLDSTNTFYLSKDLLPNVLVPYLCTLIAATTFFGFCKFSQYVNIPPKEGLDYKVPSKVAFALTYATAIACRVTMLPSLINEKQHYNSILAAVDTLLVSSLIILMNVITEVPALENATAYSDELWESTATGFGIMTLLGMLYLLSVVTNTPSCRLDPNPNLLPKLRTFEPNNDAELEHIV